MPPSQREEHVQTSDGLLLSPASLGDGWLLKAVNLGSWVHLIEELQLFEREPVESLVLSQSKVMRWALHHAVPFPLHAAHPAGAESQEAKNVARPGARLQGQRWASVHCPTSPLSYAMVWPASWFIMRPH